MASRALLIIGETDMKYAVGVDVGGTFIKFGLVNEEGVIVAKDKIPTRKEDVDPMLYYDIRDAVYAILDKAGVDRSDCLGIGIGLPGVVLSDGQMLGLTNINIGAVNIVKIMEEITGMHVRAANDANLAALGEMWVGGGRGYKDIVLLTLGTGLGGGVVVNGEVLFGTNGAGGEIGHLPIVEPEDEPESCGCGKHGCLEQYASATGMVRMARRVLAANDKPSALRDMEDLSAKNIKAAAREGDELAVEVIERVGKILGKGLAMVACVTNPQAFILGGGVAQEGEIVAETTKKYFQKYCYFPAKDTPIVLATLGNDAGLIGAARLAMEQLQ